MRVAVGIMAYNEEANIAGTIEALQKQVLKQVEIATITVVASGCTDNTVSIVRECAQADPRIVLIEQAERKGKGAAVNLFIEQTPAEYYLLVGADLLPHCDSVENLIAAFAEPTVGMVGAHPIPVNSMDTFLGYTANMIWDLHHLIAMETPKMGEMVAFRASLGKLPPNTVADEDTFAAFALAKGYHLKYVPNAIVFNKGPESLDELIMQRRRNHCAHLKLRHEHGYQPPTRNINLIGHKLVGDMFAKVKQIVWTVGIVVLEIYSRILGEYDFSRGHYPVVWRRIASSKDLSGGKPLYKGD